MSSSTVASDDGENDDEGRDDAVDGEFEASQSDEVRPVASTIGHVRHGALVRTNMALYCDDEYYCVGQQSIHNNLSFTTTSQQQLLPDCIAALSSSGGGSGGGGGSTALVIARLIAISHCPTLRDKTVSSHRVASDGVN